MYVDCLCYLVIFAVDPGVNWGLVFERVNAEDKACLGKVSIRNAGSVLILFSPCNLYPVMLRTSHFVSHFP